MDSANHRAPDTISGFRLPNRPAVSDKARQIMVSAPCSGVLNWLPTRERNWGSDSLIPGVSTQPGAWHEWRSPLFSCSAHIRVRMTTPRLARAYAFAPLKDTCLFSRSSTAIFRVYMPPEDTLMILPENRTRFFLNSSVIQNTPGRSVANVRSNPSEVSWRSLKSARHC